MELFTEQDLAPLLETREGLCVSLFLTLDRRATQHVNALRLRNLLRAVGQYLRFAPLSARGGRAA